MWNLFRHELFSRRVAIIGWGIGLTLWASMYITIYPTMAEEMANMADLDIYQAMGIDMATFAGYIGSVTVQIMPIALGVYVIMSSTGILLGEEDNGTLELVVAMPLERWQIITMKTLAMAIVLFLIMLILSVGSALALISIQDVTEVDVTPGALFVALMGAYPLVLAFFSIGLFIGTIAPTRMTATAIMAVIFIGSYLINSIAALVESLSWLETFSLFSYVNGSATVFTDGLDPADILFLLLVAAVFFGLAVVGFQRRNLTVGQWLWQRGRVPAR